MHGGGNKAALKLAIAIAIGAVVAWRVVVVNMADHYAQGNTLEEMNAALSWDPRQYEALFKRGVLTAETDPDAARRDFEAAISHNPTDGRSYAALARLKQRAGDLEGAEKAMTAAADLAPRRIDVQSEVAAFWMERGDFARAMRHWNVALRFGLELRKTLFPVLLTMAGDPNNHAAFAPLLKEPVPWWPPFFAYAAANAPELETVRALYALQAGGPNAATPVALKAYIERLQREGYWTEAYFVWLNSLPPERLNNVGNLFNGGFEEPISNMGFDWISQRAGQVLVETAPTHGATGGKALRVVFRGPRVRFRHLGQHLLLPPGRYVFRGRVRPDSLETTGGVQWAILCQGAEGQAPLATSERFAGTDPWRHFSFQFVIPTEGCPVQAARLELAGRVALDFDARGGIWFDDLSIERASLD